VDGHSETYAAPEPDPREPTFSCAAVSDRYMLNLSIDRIGRTANNSRSMSPRRARDPNELLPLKPIELLVLTMLSAGDRHGYGIRQDIVTHTGGRIALEAGNLYRHIRRLQSEGLVEESEPRQTTENDDERRIYYRLLPFGRTVLAAEMLRLRALMRVAESNHVIGPARA
jgi:DNA-binding PadR family transcriptional regulator